MSQDNLIQIVDENDNIVGSALRTEAQAKGLYHRVARIIVEDGKGKILLHKRSAEVDTYPNCWDQSAGGHVDDGENYDAAAARELAEEIGLNGVELTEIGYYQTSGKWEWRQLNRFNKAYKVVVDADTKFTLQPEEVAELRWFTVEEVQRLVSEHSDQVSDGLRQVIERFYS